MPVSSTKPKSPGLVSARARTILLDIVMPAGMPPQTRLVHTVRRPWRDRIEELENTTGEVYDEHYAERCAEYMSASKEVLLEARQYGMADNGNIFHMRSGDADKLIRTRVAQNTAIAANRARIKAANEEIARRSEERNAERVRLKKLKRDREAQMANEMERIRRDAARARPFIALGKLMRSKVTV